jgi:hypothetical protein
VVFILCAVECARVCVCVCAAQTLLSLSLYFTLFSLRLRVFVCFCVYNTTRARKVQKKKRVVEETPHPNRRERDSTLSRRYWIGKREEEQARQSFLHFFHFFFFLVFWGRSYFFFRPHFRVQRLQKRVSVTRTSHISSI